MATVIVGAAIAAMLGTGYVYLAPKIPVYEFAVVYPPILWLGDSWGELKTTLHAKLKIQNQNIVPSDVHAATFDLFFPTWNGNFVQIGHVEDKYQRQPNYETPKEGFWKLKPYELFEARDSVVLRLPIMNVFKILSHLLYQCVKGRGNLHVMSTGVAHITSTSNMKFTLTFVCDTDLNAITSKMVGNDCAIDRLHPRWSEISGVSDSMRELALTFQPNPVNGTVLVKGKPQKKQNEQS